MMNELSKKGSEKKVKKNLKIISLNSFSNLCSRCWQWNWKNTSRWCSILHIYSINRIVEKEGKTYVKWLWTNKNCINIEIKMKSIQWRIKKGKRIVSIVSLYIFTTTVVMIPLPCIPVAPWIVTYQIFTFDAHYLDFDAW